MIQMLNKEEKGNFNLYLFKWRLGGSVSVLKEEEKDDMDRILEKALIGVELAELGFSDPEPAGLRDNADSAE